MKNKLTYLLLFLATAIQAGNIAEAEDSLLSISKKMRISDMDDESKFHLNDDFQKYFQKTLEESESFKYNFKKLDLVSQLTAPDGKFKIFTWMLTNSNGMNIYFGFTQFYNKKAKRTIVHRLNDSEKGVDFYSEYNDSTWYGILYYDIVPIKKKSDTCYILLGWDGNDWLSKKRIVEPISFNSQGKPTFGAAIFQENEEVPMVKVKRNAPPINTSIKRTKEERAKLRLVFEHSAQTSMSLKYNTQLKMIVFDHLIPSDDRYKGIYAFYAPDFSYDALQYKSGKWYYKKNVDARNPRENKIKIDVPSLKKDKNKKQEVDPVPDNNLY